MKMRSIDRFARSAVGLALLAACSPGATGAPPITTTNPGSPSYSKLQLAVGTANLYGVQVGLNVVSTLRQPNGASATGVNSPQLTGPFGLVAAAQPAAGAKALADPYTTIPNGGPSVPEVTARSLGISSTPQTVQLGTPFCDLVGAAPAGFTACPSGFKPNASSFGQSGGVFAMGLAPYNVFASGQAYSYVPYAQPFYDAGDPNAPFVPWGGPPAFDPDGNGMGTRDGLVPLGSDFFNLPYFLGVGEGIAAFAGVQPHSGSYHLAVAIGVIGNGGGQQITTITASGSLTASRVLPMVTAPLVSQDPNGDGGATFTATLPSGVSEALVQIVDFGPGGSPAVSPGASSSCSSSFSSCGPVVLPNCQGPKGTAFAPVYYTVLVTHSGRYTLGTTHGPNTSQNGGRSNLKPSPSLCTAAQNKAAGETNAADTFSVQMIGFDYPAYEAAVSLTKQTVPQVPDITGPGGQSDVTISAPIVENCGASGCSAPRARAGGRPRGGRAERPAFVPPFLGVPL
jgi:hypothetical protein